MNAISKVLIPNKEWIIAQQGSKIGSVAKQKKGYVFLRNGKLINFKNLDEIQQKLGISISVPYIKKSAPVVSTEYIIYDYSCNSKPYNAVYNLKKKLPIFAKTQKSKSWYCAGYYLIKDKNIWIKSHCPKLITLERYAYIGPFKLESEVDATLDDLNKS